MPCMQLEYDSLDSFLLAWLLLYFKRCVCWGSRIRRYAARLRSVPSRQGGMRAKGALRLAGSECGNKLGIHAALADRLSDIVSSMLKSSPTTIPYLLHCVVHQHPAEEPAEQHSRAWIPHRPERTRQVSCRMRMTQRTEGGGGTAEAAP
eukprot:243287-Chlamydomonas_euryale.AAC.12